jgi:hypothetical protein
MLLCAKHSKPYLKESFTTTAGTVMDKPVPQWSIPSGSAGATLASVRGMSFDLAPVRVNVVSMGIIVTELWDVSICRHVLLLANLY